MKKRENTKITSIERHFVKHRDKKVACILEPLDLAIISQALTEINHNIYTSKAIRETKMKIHMYTDHAIDKIVMGI